MAQLQLGTLSPILVTGDSGFVGQHVLASWPGAVGLSALGPAMDVRDQAALVAGLHRLQPRAVLHLAARSFVPDSFRAPELTFEVNVMGTLRLLQALAETGFAGRFLFVGSSDAYGLVPQDALPITEERALRPRNPYAASKAAAEALCFQWSQCGPFEVLMARPFNHIGPGQSAEFVMSDFARQVARVAAGQQAPVLEVGNLAATRDFLSVLDVVRAYALVLTDGHKSEIYNVCSGSECSVQSLLMRLLALSGVEVEIRVDSARFRPADQPRMCGSFAKLHQHTGWQPQQSLDQTLLDMFRFWEKKIVS